MKGKVKLCLQVAWLATVVAILLMGTTLCAATDEACFQAGESMFFLMFWLSFPASLPFGIAAIIFAGHESIQFPSDFITAWVVMTCGGLLQWFVIVPWLFRKKELTVLNLRAPSLPAASPDTSPPDVIEVAPYIGPALQGLPAAPRVNPAKKRSRRKSIPSFSPFDKKGRTPLERVLDRL